MGPVAFAFGSLVIITLGRALWHDHMYLRLRLFTCLVGSRLR